MNEPDPIALRALINRVSLGLTSTADELDQIAAEVGQLPRPDLALRDPLTGETHWPTTDRGDEPFDAERWTRVATPEETETHIRALTALLARAQQGDHETLAQLRQAREERDLAWAELARIESAPRPLQDRITQGFGSAAIDYARDRVTLERAQALAPNLAELLTMVEQTDQPDPAASTPSAGPTSEMVRKILDYVENESYVDESRRRGPRTLAALIEQRDRYQRYLSRITGAEADPEGRWGHDDELVRLIGREILGGSPGLTDYIDVVFDGPPGAVPGRFVEVENPDGHSINAGEWIEPVAEGDELWRLRIPRIPDRHPTTTAPSLVTPTGELDPDAVWSETCRRFVGDHETLARALADGNPSLAQLADRLAALTTPPEPGRELLQPGTVTAIDVDLIMTPAEHSTLVSRYGTAARVTDALDHVVRLETRLSELSYEDPEPTAVIDLDLRPDVERDARRITELRNPQHTRDTTTGAEPHTPTTPYTNPAQRPDQPPTHDSGLTAPPWPPQEPGGGSEPSGTLSPETASQSEAVSPVPSWKPVRRAQPEAEG